MLFEIPFPQFAPCTLGIEITYYFWLILRKPYFKTEKNFD